MRAQTELAVGAEAKIEARVDTQITSKANRDTRFDVGVAGVDREEDEQLPGHLQITRQKAVARPGRRVAVFDVRYEL